MRRNSSKCRIRIIFNFFKIDIGTLIKFVNNIGAEERRHINIEIRVFLAIETSHIFKTLFEEVLRHKRPSNLFFINNRIFNP